MVTPPPDPTHKGDEKKSSPLTNEELILRTRTANCAFAVIVSQKQISLRFPLMKLEGVVLTLGQRGYHMIPPL